MAANPQKLGLIATTLLLGALSMPAFGQADNAQPPAGQPADAGGGAAGAAGGGAANQGNGGGNGGGGRFDRTQMQQRMMDRIKDMLGSSDDEFKALQPKIEAVLTLTRDLQGSGMRALFGGGGRGGRNGGGNAGAAGGGNGGGGAADQTTTPLQDKIKDLQTTLDNKDATADDIKAKLQAVRDARTTVKTNLDKARADLKDLLTARQEAVLVELGLLE